ncbi:MAG TPA: flagellar hook-basal body complex protein [Clostridiales bacterium]|nr:flagellar hook-basal body complex protein [Clostridiales bacterium]
MVRGFYAAAAGMLSGQRKLDGVSNNLANVSTTGYKAQTTIESACDSRKTFRLEGGQMADPLGSSTFRTANIDTHIDFSQGSIARTERALDASIRGEGFFVVRTDAHGDVLTRNGGMALDEKRVLVVPGVGKVLSDSGREITVKSSDFVIGKDGKIYEDGKETARLYVAVPGEGDQPEAVAEGVYKYDGGYKKAEEAIYAVEQGSLESSNVNVAQELSRLISGQGHFQSCAQILRIYDRINEISVNRIGSLD